MAKNMVATGTDKLFSQCEEMADGCNKHQNALSIMHITEAVVRAKLQAARTGDATYQTGKATKIAATESQGAADEQGKKYILAARDVLKRYLGTSWSQTWEQTGFPGRSLAVPKTLDERMELLKSLEGYFAAHADQENEPLDITGVAAHDLSEALLTAQSGLNTCRRDLVQTKEVRDEALEALRKAARRLILELYIVMEDDDGRWLDFGLSVPAGTESPEIPEGLNVQGAGSGHLLAEWETSPRADRYRIYKQVVGVNEDYVLAATVTDTSANLNTFTPASMVRIKVSAVNAAGESQSSEVVEAQVP